jgi:hypothetical protein
MQTSNRAFYSFLAGAIALLFLGSLEVQAEPPFKLPNKNMIYDNAIRTVKFHLEGLPTSQPLVDLGSRIKLQLTFDDMSESRMDYYYTIYHCNADWETSDIEPLEYLKIYEEGEIRNFFYSGVTQVPYAHYRLKLPNNEIDWQISGNYMLVVYYYDGDEKVPIFTRRFMVAENRYSIDARFTFPSQPGTLLTHHEMQATVNVKKSFLRIPQQQIRLYVYQNGRWDRNVSDLMFNRFMGDEYYFNLPGMISLPSPKEFRPLDNRFINSPGGQIAHFERNEDGFLAMLVPDFPRDRAPYLTYFDLNGQYVIMDREANLMTMETVTYDQTADPDSLASSAVVTQRRVNLDSMCLNCEYVDILFTLRVENEASGDVYIFGDITGWSLDPLFKMEYDPSRQAYFAKVQLKQGYYDYQYVVDKGNGVIDSEELEGGWHEAENDYLFLVYDRHPFNRGDRLLGARIINSSQANNR